MLLRSDEWSTAAQVYDGDVVTHPISGETVTFAIDSIWRYVPDQRR
ncbi:hypothetical protein [Agrococcus sp. Ld7]